MRRTTLAAVAALAVLPALSFASAPPDTLPESYPAVMWQAVDSATQALLADGDRWPLYAAHPVLERLLPDVRFFDRVWSPVPHSAVHSAFAVYNGKKYGLKSLNSLLVDAGFKFDTTEFQAVAKIALLWSLMDQQDFLCTRRYRRSDPAAHTVAIQAVTFKKIERRRASVLVGVDIATTFEVGPASGACTPPDTLPESYSAVGWQKVDSAEQAQLRDRDRWPLAAVHPELVRLLPDVKFYMRRWARNPRTTAPASHGAYAILNGKKYGPESLKSLLVDAGYSFDTSEVRAVSKISVLWSLMDQQASLHTHLPVYRSDSAELATAVPSVTFRKIEQRPASALVEVDIATAVEVGFVRGTCIPELVACPGKCYGVLFDGPVCGPATPPAPQK